MAKKQPGYKAKLYYGNAGATAATQVLHIKDLKLSNTKDYGDTTDRGDGDSVPKEDTEIVKEGLRITFNCNLKDSEATVAALMAAADANTLKAFKYVNSAGVTKFDGDCDIKYDDESNLGDPVNIPFELTPTSAGGRQWARS